jgi:hypothetical protein
MLLFGRTVSNVVVEGPGRGLAWMEEDVSLLVARNAISKKSRSVSDVKNVAVDFLLRSSSLVVVIVSSRNFASDASSNVAHSVFLEAREARQGVRRPDHCLVCLFDLMMIVTSSASNSSRSKPLSFSSAFSGRPDSKMRFRGRPCPCLEPRVMR